MCLTHSSKSKMDISFKERFCGFFHACWNSLHAYAFGLFINCSKQTPGKASDMLPLEGRFMTCQTGQKIN